MTKLCLETGHNFTKVSGDLIRPCLKRKFMNQAEVETIDTIKNRGKNMPNDSTPTYVPPSIRSVLNLSEIAPSLSFSTVSPAKLSFFVRLFYLMNAFVRSKMVVAHVQNTFITINLCMRRNSLFLFLLFDFLCFFVSEFFKVREPIYNKGTAWISLYLGSYNDISNLVSLDVSLIAYI